MNPCLQQYWAIGIFCWASRLAYGCYPLCIRCTLLILRICVQNDINPFNASRSCWCESVKFLSSLNFFVQQDVSQTSCLISPISNNFFQYGFSNMCIWKSWKMVIHMLLHLCSGSMHALLQFGSVEAVVGPWGFSPKLAWFPLLMILEGFCCIRYSNLYTQKQDLELRSNFFCVCAYESSTTPVQN
jgi:hypothetical protein